MEAPEMDDELTFLRPDVIIEPLVDGFYAWLHTVAPAQAAMNLAFVQVPLLESYLQSPQVHITAPQACPAEFSASVRRLDL
jgi:Diiron non-heme beta-hydroxylase N-terminal domain